MQAATILLSAALMSFVAFTIPTEIFPKKLKPKSHAFESLYITNYQELMGTNQGYCFPWAVAVAKRQEGKTIGEPTWGEWANIERDTHVDINTGGVGVIDVFTYYGDRGYNTEYVEINTDKDCSEYYYAAEKMDEKCVVMLIMYPKEPFPGIGGHIETVVGIDKCSANTNSWGSLATVTTKKRFHHTNMIVYNRLKMASFFMIACK